MAKTVSDFHINHVKIAKIQFPLTYETIFLRLPGQSEQIGPPVNQQLLAEMRPILAAEVVNLGVAADPEVLP